MDDLAALQRFAMRYTAAWCSQQPDTVASFFADDGSLAINGGAPHVGRAAIAETARSFMTLFPDLRVTMDRVVSFEDRIEYHWTLTGTAKTSDGAESRVCISGFETWKLDSEGRIGSSLGHFDAEEYERQLAAGLSDPRNGD